MSKDDDKQDKDNTNPEQVSAELANQVDGDDAELCCSFCGKKKSQVSRLIQAQSGVAICNECAITYQKTISDQVD